MPELEGKTVLITGSGSLGVSARTARCCLPSTAPRCWSRDATLNEANGWWRPSCRPGGRPIPARGPRQPRRRGATGGRGRRS
jgi:hypothetical protein